MEFRFVNRLASCHDLTLPAVLILLHAGAAYVICVRHSNPVMITILLALTFYFFGGIWVGWYRSLDLRSIFCGDYRADKRYGPGDEVRYAWHCWRCLSLALGQPPST